VAVTGGLAASTLLTLVVVPVVYTLVDDALAVLRRRGRVGAGIAAPAGEAGTAPATRARRA
jgi:hypothetical protein